MTFEKVPERERSAQDTPAESLARRVFREAVVEVALQAKQVLPACHSRIEAAIKIVIAGDIEELADGTAKVASQSDGATTYHIVNGHCDCPDVKQAPEGWCKHRLSAAIAKRAQALTTQRLQALENQHNDQGQDQETSEKSDPSRTNSLPQNIITANFHTRLDWLLAQVQIRQRYSRAWENQIDRARTLFQQR